MSVPDGYGSLIGSRTFSPAPENVEGLLAREFRPKRVIAVLPSANSSHSSAGWCTKGPQVRKTEAIAAGESICKRLPHYPNTTQQNWGQAIFFAGRVAAECNEMKRKILPVPNFMRNGVQLSPNQLCSMPQVSNIFL
jgi:hypothetical protein